MTVEFFLYSQNRPQLNHQVTALWNPTFTQLTGRVYWAWLGLRKFSSQEPTKSCILNGWPKKRWQRAYVLAIARQHQGPLFLTLLPQWAGLGWTRGWEGTADMRQAGGCPLQYNVMLSNKTAGEAALRYSCSRTGWASVCWWQVTAFALLTFVVGFLCLFLSLFFPFT